MKTFLSQRGSSDKLRSRIISTKKFPTENTHVSFSRFAQKLHYNTNFRQFPKNRSNSESRHIHYESASFLSANRYFRNDSQLSTEQNHEPISTKSGHNFREIFHRNFPRERNFHTSSAPAAPAHCIDRHSVSGPRRRRGEPFGRPSRPHPARVVRSVRSVAPAVVGAGSIASSPPLFRGFRRFPLLILKILSSFRFVGML